MAKPHTSTAISALILSCVGAWYLLPASVLAQDQGTEGVKTVFATPPTPNNNQLSAYLLNEAEKAMLKNAVAASTRIDKQRDIYRHPYETLDFFGIKSNSKIIEIWPGQGWYSSVLSDYLKQGGGELIAAQFDTSTTNSPLVKEVVDSYSNKFAKNPQDFGKVSVVPFGPRSKDLGAKDSVDAVLTFRNIHNWLNQGWAEKAFDDFFKVLKPGGILGVEEHRAGEDSPQDPIAADGYVRQDYVIDLAKEAGFVFINASEINANLKDSKDHPFGVWTLPPVGRTAPAGKPPNPNFDQSKYKEIGESDRMTLLFMKPYPAPAKMAEKKDKSKKDSNPFGVIFGSKTPKQPEPSIPVILTPPKTTEPENSIKIVFEPVKVAYNEPTKVLQPPKPPKSEPLEPIKVDNPNAVNVDFSAPKPPPALPDFSVPSDYENQNLDDNPPPKNVENSKKPEKSKADNKKTPKPWVKPNVEKPIVKEKPEPTKTAKTTSAKGKKPPESVKSKTIDKDVPNWDKKSKKPAPSAKKTDSNTKTIVKKPDNKAKTIAKKPDSNAKTIVKKPAATTKPAAKKPAPTKKDPTIPDWNVKTKKKK